MSDCNGNSIIQPIVQDLNALGERIGKAIDSATADRDVQLLEGALLALAEARTRLQGKTPVTPRSAPLSYRCNPNRTLGNIITEVRITL